MSLARTVPEGIAPGSTPSAYHGALCPATEAGRSGDGCGTDAHPKGTTRPVAGAAGRGGTENPGRLRPPGVSARSPSKSTVSLLCSRIVPPTPLGGLPRPLRGGELGGQGVGACSFIVGHLSDNVKDAL